MFLIILNFFCTCSEENPVFILDIVELLQEEDELRGLKDCREGRMRTGMLSATAAGSGGSTTSAGSV